MHATIRSYERAAGLADLITERKDEINRLFSAIPGFRGYQLVKTGAAECVSVTIFDDAAGSQAGIEAAREWVAANAGHLNVPPPQVSTGEVAFSLP